MAESFVASPCDSCGDRGYRQFGAGPRVRCTACEGPRSDPAVVSAPLLPTVEFVAEDADWRRVWRFSEKLPPDAVQSIGLWFNDEWQSWRRDTANTWESEVTGYATLRAPNARWCLYPPDPVD